MYGGTAKTYCRWELKGEPFKEGNAYYVVAIHPATKFPKKVRWYTDAAHAALMPNQKPKEFLGKIFGFENDRDFIIAIREADLSEDEISQYFYFNWGTSTNSFEKCWRYGEFFGGIWYAPKDAVIPPIQHKEKLFHPTWEEFVRAAQLCPNIRDNPNGFWFKKEVTG